MITQTMCKYAEGVICLQTSECKDCPVYEGQIDKANIALDLCPVCGADRQVWREMFRTEHICFAK